MAAAIEIKKLKKYFGKVKAVDGISFNVDKGEILGFLGPNGAGKSTTIKCLMDFERPTEGKIVVAGLDSQADSVAIKEKVGFISGDIKLYDKWTGNDHIEFIEKIRGKSKIAHELCKKFEYNPKIKVKNLSSGNKQKLGLILALMSEPKILVLDEPTVGLDPLLQNSFYEVLEDFKRKGTTIFMSSHNLAEVEKICDRVAIIKTGKLVAVETIENIGEKKMHLVNAYFDEKPKKIDFGRDVEVLKREDNELLLKIKGDLNPVIKVLSAMKLRDLEVTHATLEEVFLEFYGRK
ncbi:MAG: ABC transporter ATP-binding protein [Patescibacteria group bacterium]|nr:ABC transporter ATP-binding protein [Patescibacteria group bacterium]